VVGAGDGESVPGEVGDGDGGGVGVLLGGVVGDGEGS